MDSRAEYISDTPVVGYGSYTLSPCVYLVRKKDILPSEYIKLTIATCGSVDAGKTTTQAVLVNYPIKEDSEFDDGRGLVRSALFNHKHEKETGRTSSISRMILSYDENNMSNNKKYALTKSKRGGRDAFRLKDWPLIIGDHTKKLVTMIDLCGHEKYRKTTISGSMSEVIDYVMIVISSNDNGIKTITREHILLAMSLKIPFFIVMTKSDYVTPVSVQDYTYECVRKLLSLKAIQKTPLLIKNITDITNNLRQPSLFHEVIPIIRISNVTGFGIDILTDFIGCLPRMSSQAYHDMADDTYARITEVYFVRGIGTVVLVSVMSGSLKQNDTVHIGPFYTAPYFRETRCKSIQKNRIPVTSCSVTDVVTVAVTTFRKQDIRRGMILASDPMRRVVTRTFVAYITVLRHNTTISTGYKPVIYIANVRQSAKVMSIVLSGNADPTQQPTTQIYLRTRDTAHITFTFESGPEYIRVSDSVIINDGNMKATGVIVSLVS